MFDFNAVDGGDHLPRLDACQFGRATRHDSRHQRTAGAVEAKGFGHFRGHRFEACADEGTDEGAIAAVSGRDEDLYQIGGDSKADAVRAATLGEDRGVDADQLTVHVDEAAAGIARIDRRIRLDKEAEIP
ncbi:hypothetical protein D9M72_558680 [compost metagenome]